jgi:hypothetical protein
MIRRRVEGGFLLVRQAEHARLAAELLNSLGGRFAQPCLGPELMAAAKLHESGFDDVDNRPMLDAAGRPMHFAALPRTALLHAWEKSSQNAEAAGAYQGMLVSVLSMQRAAALPTTVRTTRELFETNKHQHLEIERQERLRPVLGLRNDVSMRHGLPDTAVLFTEAEARFVYDYRLLVMLSQLTLEMCVHQPLRGDLLPCPSKPEEEAASIHFWWTDEHWLELDPWPFAVKELPMTFRAKVVPNRNYDHEIELLEAMEGMKQGLVEVGLRAGDLKSEI